MDQQRVARGDGAHQGNLDGFVLPGVVRAQGKLAALVDLEHPQGHSRVATRDAVLVERALRGELVCARVH